jgi:Ca2+:H+ antiporter
MQIALHKLAAVHASTNGARSAKGFTSFLRAEFPLIIGLASAAFFLAIGSGAVEEVDHPLALAGVFVWLLIGVLWSAISVVRHADSLALRCGEPYGTLILTLSAITIEVVMISAAMLHGANNPTLARDMMFAVVVITLNGLVGLALLLGGLRHHEQYYNIQGTSSYLNTIMALVVLGLVLPNFTTSLSGPRFSLAQELFLVVTSLSLYGIFLITQTRRHRQYFMEPEGAEVSAESRSSS